VTNLFAASRNSVLLASLISVIVDGFASQVIAHAQRPPRLLPNHGQDRSPGTVPTTHPFSTTAPVKASEDDNFLGPLRDSPLLKQIAGNPEALGALQDFMSLMVKNGVDMSSKPSTMTLIKLASNTELRDAAKRFVTALQKAGIDINPQNAMELLAGPNGWTPKK